MAQQRDIHQRINKALEPFRARLAEINERRIRASALAEEAAELRKLATLAERDWYASGAARRFEEIVKSVSDGGDLHAVELKSEKQRIEDLHTKAQIAEAAVQELRGQVQVDQHAVNAEIRTEMKPILFGLTQRLFDGCETITKALGEIKEARDSLNSEQVHGLALDIPCGFFIPLRIDEETSAQRWFEGAAAMGIYNPGLKRVA